MHRKAERAHKCAMRSQMSMQCTTLGLPHENSQRRCSKYLHASLYLCTSSLVCQQPESLPLDCTAKGRQRSAKTTVSGQRTGHGPRTKTSRLLCLNHASAAARADSAWCPKQAIGMASMTLNLVWTGA